MMSPKSWSMNKYTFGDVIRHPDAKYKVRAMVIDPSPRGTRTTVMILHDEDVNIDGPNHIIRAWPEGVREIADSWVSVDD